MQEHQINKMLVSQEKKRKVRSKVWTYKEINNSSSQCKICGDV